MALVNLDGVPLTQVGFPIRSGSFNPGSWTTIDTVDAVNEAIISIGQIWTTDGGSHTINTTGSSSLGWRTNNVAVSNAGTIVKVGLAAVDNTSGPPARAVNVANVITFNVSRSIVGNSGGITDNAWQEHVPDNGSMTIANGDIVAFCTQMTARGGTDLYNTGGVSPPFANTSFPCVTTYTGGSYLFSGFLPTVRISFSDGARGYFIGGAVQNGAATAVTWSSGSAQKEYGNAFTLPFPARIYGVVASLATTGPVDFVLYSTPFGTPVAERTISLSQRQVGVAGIGTVHMLFTTPYDAQANQPLAIIFKPGATNITTYYRSVSLAWDQDQDSGGDACYGAYRATASFFPLYTDRYMIGATLQGFLHPARSSHILGL